MISKNKSGRALSNSRLDTLTCPSFVKHLLKLFLFTSLLFIPNLFAEQPDACFSGDTEQGMIDKAYHYLNTKFCQPALWFDSFFADDRVTEGARAGTRVRWYNDLIVEEAGNLTYQSKLTASIHLPKVTKKLKLVFESDYEDDAFTDFSDNDKQNSALGLRYDIRTKGRSSFNIKVTLKPSIEARYRYIYPFTEQTLARLTQKIYQKKGVTGEISQFDLDHAFAEKYLLRWANFAQLESATSGFEIGTGLTLYQYISKKQALSYKANIIAQESSSYRINHKHLSVTYRHNILKKWFFYELTPEINWDKEDNTATQKEASFTLRLEVLFKNF